jgi:hypothetical protein
MLYTAKVRASLAEYLLENPNPNLRRRLSILRSVPFPPGSRSLASDATWHSVTRRFPGLQAYVYGTSQDALVYTYDGGRQLLVVEFAILEGVLLP